MTRSKELEGVRIRGVWFAVTGPLLIMAWTATVIGGTALYASLVHLVIYPLSGLLGVAIAWYWWRGMRSKGYTYRDRNGDVVQGEPYVISCSALVLACVMAMALGWYFQGILRFAIPFLPSTPVVFDTHVTGLASGKWCRVFVLYEETVTSDKMQTCVENVPGKRWIGEPITVYETVGILGTKLERVDMEGKGGVGN
jgi:hypothetical protein